MFTYIRQSCNGVYINETRIDADKWVEVKVKDQLCFGTPISNNSFRYVLEQLTNEDYQLVQEEFIAEEELSGGIKKKPSEMGVTDTSETGAVNSEKEEPTRNYNNKANPDEVAVSTSSIVDGTKRYEMLSSMQEEFLCVICQELFVKAHSLSCSHSYCEKCINDWMKKGNKYCPMCRKAIEGKPVPSIAMDNAIDKLVKCLSEEAQKERAELLEERKPSKKEVILISDSPVRPGSSVITRSVSRRNNPVHLVSSDSDSDSSELSSSEDDDDEPEQHEGFDYGDDSIDDELEGYTGLPGHSWGGYGHCYRCGMCLGKLIISFCSLSSQEILATGRLAVPTANCIIMHSQFLIINYHLQYSAMWAVIKCMFVSLL